MKTLKTQQFRIHLAFLGASIKWVTSHLLFHAYDETTHNAQRRSGAAKPAGKSELPIRLMLLLKILLTSKRNSIFITFHFCFFCLRFNFEICFNLTTVHYTQYCTGNDFVLLHNVASRLLSLCVSLIWKIIQNTRNVSDEKFLFMTKLLETTLQSNAELISSFLRVVVLVCLAPTLNNLSSIVWPTSIRLTIGNWHRTQQRNEKKIFK